MIEIEYRTTIGRPPGDVFAALIDVASYPRWQTGVLEIRPLDEGPIAVGSRFLEVREILNRAVEGTTEIMALETDRLMEFRCPEGTIPFDGSYTCEPTDGGTQVVVRMALSPTGFLKMAGGFLNMMFKKSLEANFERLREQLEGQG